MVGLLAAMAQRSMALRVDLANWLAAPPEALKHTGKYDAESDVPGTMMTSKSRACKSQEDQPGGNRRRGSRPRAAVPMPAVQDGEQTVQGHHIIGQGAGRLHQPRYARGTVQVEEARRRLIARN